MSKKTILVVDDEKDVAYFLKDLLEDNGYSVVVAHDGVEGMQKVKSQKPDLILLDLQMPEETGTGFFRRLRNKSDLKDIPVIIISGLAGRNIAVTKSVTVIDKPPKEDEILREVEKALGKE